MIIELKIVVAQLLVKKYYEEFSYGKFGKIEFDNLTSQMN